MTPYFLNVEMLIVLVQEQPEIWDQRDAHCANRARKEASWRRICRQMLHDFADRPREEQQQQQTMEDVMRRWRSIRDQYRRERQQRARSGDAGHIKRKYIYYDDRLSFLAPILDLRPTQSNLTERETGSDTEPIIDPGSVGEEVAGPSSPPPRSMGEDSSQENQCLHHKPHHQDHIHKQDRLLLHHQPHWRSRATSPAAQLPRSRAPHSLLDHPGEEEDGARSLPKIPVPMLTQGY
ncbi:uncharacterized protein [Dendrobates tinctorius]|uniref:uncharacterized protein n=1 Tax=Dendrobates tinctorius TaxID=92724 RepID=UPI003CC92AA6